MTQSDDKPRVSRPEVLRQSNHKLLQSGVQYLLQFFLVFGLGLCEQEAPDAHCWILDVAGLQYTVEVTFDALEIYGAVGLVGLVQDDETEHIVFDAVPHGGVIGTGAFEIGPHGQ